MPRSSAASADSLCEPDDILAGGSFGFSLILCLALVVGYTVGLDDLEFQQSSWGLLQAHSAKGPEMADQVPASLGPLS